MVQGHPKSKRLRGTGGGWWLRVHNPKVTGCSLSPRLIPTRQLEPPHTPGNLPNTRDPTALHTQPSRREPEATPGLNPPALGSWSLPPLRPPGPGPRSRRHLRPRWLGSDGDDPDKPRDQPQQRRPQQTHRQPAPPARSQSRKSRPEPEEDGHTPQTNADKSRSRAPSQSMFPSRAAGARIFLRMRHPEAWIR